MRNRTLDVMKAIFIIGIVVLHANFIHYGENTTLSNMLRLICVNGFFVLSGYVIYGKVQDGKWLGEKIIRRIPMLIIFPIIYWVFNRFVVGIDGGQRITANLFDYYSYNIGTGFILSVLWYIWVITIVYVVLYVFEKCKLNKIPYLLQLIVIVGLFLVPLDYGGLDLVRWYGLFMIGGYVAAKYKSGNQWWWIVVGVITGFLSFKFPVNYQGEAVNGGYADILKTFTNGEWGYVLMYIGVTSIGYIVVANWAWLMKRTSLSKFTQFIGTSTIGILLLHKPILEMGLVDNYWLSALIAFSVSLTLYYAISRVRILDYVFFGGTDIPIKISKKLGGWYGEAKG